MNDVSCSSSQAMIHLTPLHRRPLCYVIVSCDPCDSIPQCVLISPVYQQEGRPGKSKCSLLSLVQEAAAKQNAKQHREAQLLGVVQRIWTQFIVSGLPFLTTPPAITHQANPQAGRAMLRE